MYYHDYLITRVFVLEKNNRIRYKFHYVMESDKYPNIKNYILNRYDDSKSPQETLRRIQYGIETRPVCKKCGKEVIYIGKPDSVGLFKEFCSKSCANSYNAARSNKTKLMKYGSVNNEQKRRQTCLDKYGEEYYNNHEQTVRTNIERYGGIAPACDKEILNKIVEASKQTYLEHGDEINKKRRSTNLKRYGDENYRNVKKIKETWNNKSEEELSNIKERTRQTLIDRYDDPNYRNTEKANKTKLERYGNAKYNNSEKSKKTSLERYGADSYSKTPIFKKMIAKKWADEIRHRVYNTKKCNNSFNISNVEKKINEILYDFFGDELITQYKSEKYPWTCDFYIKSLDLYIEYQGSWTHGGIPYDSQDNNCISQLQLWEEKSKESQYYKNAVETWTIRDIEKRTMAKNNNLNYIELWTPKDAIIFIMKLLNSKNIDINNNECMLYDTLQTPLNLNGRLLTGDYIASLDEDKLYLLIYDIYKYYNNLEFPLPILDDSYIKDSLNKLARYDTSSICDNNNIVSNFGHLCTDICKYMCGDKFYKSSFNGARSVYDAYNDNYLLLEGIKNRILYQTENGKRVVYQIDHSQIVKGLTNSGISKLVSNFKPVVAKWIYEYAMSICKTDSLIKSAYDYSAGWGARMIAAYSLGINYTGTDPNTGADLQIFADKYLSNINMYKYCSEDDELYNKISMQDIIGSCPPYFDLERYSDDDSQCYNKYNNYERWLNEYWTPTVIKSYSKLNDGGVFFVVIDNKMKEDIVNIVLKNTSLKVHSEFLLKSPKSHLYNKKNAAEKNKYSESIVFFKRK